MYNNAIPVINELSHAQRALRELRRERTLARLDQLLIAARASPFTIGDRRTQPTEVQALQRRVRGVTQRCSPISITRAARDAAPWDRIDVDHVVPVIVLVERMLLGDDAQPVLQQAALCRLTHEEHRLDIPGPHDVKRLVGLL